MILGSAGMLGHMVYIYLRSLNKYEIIDSSFPNRLNRDSKILDVTNVKKLENFISVEKPDIVVNCIGILIKDSISFPSNAIYLNAYFPHQLVKILKGKGGKLIHISTDCVFSGKKGAYTEDDYRDADDIYGRSKALGEIMYGGNVTLRTSIIGPELKKMGEGLFHWFMQQNGTINGFSNVFWGGITTLELAKAIDSTIEQDISGLIHITNKERISKYDLLVLIKHIFCIKTVQIDRFEGKIVDKSLKSNRNDFKYKVTSYKKMISELKSFMEENRVLYSRIYDI